MHKIAIFGEGRIKRSIFMTWYLFDHSGQENMKNEVVGLWEE